MKRDLLLVVDMQNVYGTGGEWCCPGMEAAAEKILSLMTEKSELDVVFTQFLAPETPVGCWREYNRVNAAVNADPHANAYVQCFSEALKRYPLYTKSTYSSLTVPEVLAACRAARRVLVCGVVAECCVLATVFGLIDEGISTVYLTDAVAGIDGGTEEAVKTVLAGLAPVHLEQMTTEAYLSVNRQQPDSAIHVV